MIVERYYTKYICTGLYILPKCVLKHVSIFHKPNQQGLNYANCSSRGYPDDDIKLHPTVKLEFCTTGENGITSLGLLILGSLWSEEGVLVG